MTLNSLGCPCSDERYIAKDKCIMCYQYMSITYLLYSLARLKVESSARLKVIK